MTLWLFLSACDASRQRQPDTAEAGVSAADTLNPGTAAGDSAGDSAVAALALDGEGLRVFLLPSGSSRPLAFGTPYEAALATINSALGAAPVEEGFNADCQAEFARWEDGLGVWFVGERFVGWSIRSADAGITTASGVGIGSTRTELEDSYEIRVFRSSLGTEFTAGGLAGLLESPGPNARVVNLWAGQTCIAR